MTAASAIEMRTVLVLRNQFRAYEKDFCDMGDHRTEWVCTNGFLLTYTLFQMGSERRDSNTRMIFLENYARALQTSVAVTAARNSRLFSNRRARRRLIR